jgi:hypothetical protein
VLTLTGSATLANYQSALRSVTYLNTSDNPSTATRTVSFVVNDGTRQQHAATRNIAVTAVNDAPVVTTTGAAGLHRERRRHRGGQRPDRSATWTTPPSPAPR